MKHGFLSSCKALREDGLRWGRWVCLCFAILVTDGAVRSVAGFEPPEVLQRTGEAFSQIAERAIPAVVYIEVQKTLRMQTPRQFRGGLPPQLQERFGLPDGLLEEFFFPQQRDPRQERHFRQDGQGSGFLMSADGYILTNSHVVNGADRITVRLHGGREYSGALVGADERSDVAIIKIEGEDFPFLDLGDSAGLRIGEWVIAVGAPFGLTETVTAGIVSAKGRSNIGLPDYDNFIQTDAAINPGNSGGPLLNIRGEVVGINTAIFMRSGGYMGIGFAIPINMATGIRDQLVETGRVDRGFLGIYIQELTPDLAEGFDLAERSGIVIGSVTAESAADNAGMKAGDIIIEINGIRPGTVAEFRNGIASMGPGKSLALTILRDGEERAVTAVTGGFEGDAVASLHSGQEDEPAARLGFTVQNLDDAAAARLGYEGLDGVLVSAVESGSNAERRGLQPGSLIMSVQQKTVSHVTEFNAAVSAARQSGVRAILLHVRHGEASRFLALRFE